MSMHLVRTVLNRVASTCGYPARLANRVLGRAQRRAARARPGSVLILVIALLVLLALIGTAFITTTGNDRQASVQHRYNVQVQLLVQGLKDMASGLLVSKIAPYDPPASGTGLPSFRPASTTAIPLAPFVAPQYFTNVDSFYWDTMLADRYPDGVGGSTTTPASATGWNAITGNPLVAHNPAQPMLTTDQWRSPLVGVHAGVTFVQSASSRGGYQPFGVNVTLPSGTVRNYPAFLIRDSADPNANKAIIAGDADGDGIPDSALFELPMGEIDGVRYYGAMRIIDNAAAINASVAMESMPGTGLATDQLRLPTDVFPVNVDFRRLVEGPNNAPADGTDPDPDNNPVTPSPYWDGLNAERFGYSSLPPTVPFPSLTPVREDGGAVNFQFASRYDAAWFMLGARLDSPGQRVTGSRYRSLGLNESVTMASRFSLATPGSVSSVLERTLPKGTRMAKVNREPFAPSDALTWFQQIFDYEYLTATAPNQIPLRPLVTGHNPITQYVPSHNTALTDELTRKGRYQYRGDWAATVMYQSGDWVRFLIPAIGSAPARNAAFVCVRNHTSAAAFPPFIAAGTPRFNFEQWAEAPWFSHPVKINPNTANFGLLYNAFSTVLYDGPRARPTVAGGGYNTSEYGTGFNANDYWTLGNVMRPTAGAPTRYLTGADLSTPVARQQNAYLMRQLRAALAAINTIDLRDYDDDITSRTIQLTAVDGTVVRTAHVYGSERQPYITEACAHLGDDGKMWVAIELYNPYPVALDTAAFRLAYRGRSSADGVLTLIDRLSTAGVTTIPPQGYAYIENAIGMRPNDVAGNPAMTSLAWKQMASLEEVLKNGGIRELYLLRTRKFDGNFSNSADPANTFNESDSNLVDLVPVDQLEFGGIVQEADPVTPTIMVSTRYHYRRANATGGAQVNPWHAVYAGPYNPTPAASERRQRGWIRDPLPVVPPDPTKPPLLQLPGFGQAKNKFGIPPTHNDPPTSSSFPSNVATFRTRTLQIANLGMGGPWGMLTAERRATGAFKDPTPPVFPLGGFVRTGDILQVPFIGGYRINDTDLIELNSVTMDAAFAEDGDNVDDDTSGGLGNGSPVEQLGRFCPLQNGTVLDLNDYPTYDPNIPPASTRYHWATDLFDYFTVTSPQDDYLPNVDPGGWLTVAGTTYNITSGDPTVSGSNAKWPYSPAPEPVANTISNKPNYGREDNGSVQGLININTANVKVMSLIPFVPNTTPANKLTNWNIAKAIVDYRRTVGPIRNLFELQKIPEVANAFGDPSVLDPQALTHGDLSPLDESLIAPTGGDGVAGDFEARYMAINRVSNMIAFRSDCFTVYVLVQGWRNAGTGTPELVVQRRAGMILDRSTVRPILGTAGTGARVTEPSSVNVPQN